VRCGICPIAIAHSTARARKSHPSPAPQPFAGEPAADLLGQAVDRVDDEIELQSGIDIGTGPEEQVRRAIRAVAIAFVREHQDAIERHIPDAGLDALAPMIAAESRPCMTG
jgi:hypothetical protein